MTTENTGSPHDPDYNISVSSTPDSIPPTIEQLKEAYNPPVGSTAARTYDPNKLYPDGTWERAHDAGRIDEEFVWPESPPNRSEMMLHRISEGFNKILDKLDIVEETRATVVQQEAKIETILILLEKTLREIKANEIKPK
tara:strand:- start:3116 stop:3535 length:420 start_codon:yes stop_codon:yes gene_type:complete